MFNPHGWFLRAAWDQTGKGQGLFDSVLFLEKEQDPLNLAGIYTTTEDGWNTFAVLTKYATPLFEKIHKQMQRRPVVIEDDNLDSWLMDNMDMGDVQQMMDDDLWDSESVVCPITKELYSKSVDSNREHITNPCKLR